jgi:hypothetical protein
MSASPRLWVVVRTIMRGVWADRHRRTIPDSAPAAAAAAATTTMVLTKLPDEMLDVIFSMLADP